MTRPSAASLLALADDALLEAVQRQTFRFFWEGAHPKTAMAPDRRGTRLRRIDDLVATGGTGFGVMALIVAVERGWVTRAQALERLGRMLDFLGRTTCYHGAYPHFMNARTGACIPLTRKDDGGDLMETALLIMGLLCARAYFDRDAGPEPGIRGRIEQLWSEVEWSWYTREGGRSLYWHWSPNNGWSMNHPIRGWNECLIAYVLAAGAPRYAVDAAVYHEGFAAGPGFRNGRSYYGVPLPLGPPYGGPLFFAHYSFCGLDPRGLRDRHADYWEQNLNHVRIQLAHARENPGDFAGHGADCWGLTSSDDPEAGYRTHSPAEDNGTISPTAALSSFPYAPAEAMRALRHFLGVHGRRLWGRYGFADAFNVELDWYAETYLAIDQGPIIAMIENHRTGLLWRLFMSVPEVRVGLRRLGFSSPQLLDPPP